MSYRALRWAAKQSLPAHEKLVLFMLADMADLQEKCWPSVPKLMEVCNLSRAQVQKCRKRLEERGLVRKEGRIRSYGNTSNMYYLNLSEAFVGEDDTPPPIEAPPPPIEAHNLYPLTSRT